MMRGTFNVIFQASSILVDTIMKYCRLNQTDPFFFFNTRNTYIDSFTLLPICLIGIQRFFNVLFLIDQHILVDIIFYFIHTLGT